MDACYVDLADARHLEFDYLRWSRIVLEAVGARRVLHIGGAGCALARALAAADPESRHEVAEVDAHVLEFAREHLGLRRAPGLRVRVAEGRAAIEARGDDARTRSSSTPSSARGYRSGSSPSRRSPTPPASPRSRSSTSSTPARSTTPERSPPASFRPTPPRPPSARAGCAEATSCSPARSIHSRSTASAHAWRPTRPRPPSSRPPSSPASPPGPPRCAIEIAAGWGSEGAARAGDSGGWRPVPPGNGLPAVERRDPPPPLERASQCERQDGGQTPRFISPRGGV